MVFTWSPPAGVISDVYRFKIRMCTWGGKSILDIVNDEKDQLGKKGQTFHLFNCTKNALIRAFIDVSSEVNMWSNQQENVNKRKAN